MTFAEVIDEIFLTVTPKKRLGTRLMHKRYLGQIKESIGDKKVQDFSLIEYHKWIQKLRDSKSGRRETFNDYTKHFNIISNFAYQRRYITHLIKYPVTDDPDRITAWRIYTKPEMQALWDNSQNDLKLQIQLILSLECFMRLREVLYLSWDRVDFEDRKIILRKQDVKTGTRSAKGRVVPLSKNAYEKLLELKKTATTEWVFPNPAKTGPIHENRKSWYRIKKASKIKGQARWHDLRHTALSIATVELNVNLTNLSKVSGVSVKTLLKVYAHAKVDHLREVTEAINLKKIA